MVLIENEDRSFLIQVDSFFLNFLTECGIIITTSIARSIPEWEVEKMKKTEYTEHDIKEFANWVQSQRWAFDISQDELAKAIGVTQKTISHYENAEIVNFPNKEIIDAINSFFYEKAEQLGDYTKLPANEFADKLNILLGEFEMSQAKLAKAIGKRQEDISNYISHKTEPDIWTQHKILLYFYRLSMSSTEYSSLHFGTAVHLDNLLHGKESSAAYFDEKDVKIGDTASFRECTQYMLTLPVPLQDFILKHLEAFYDNTMEILHFECKFDFHFLSYAIELFRQLDEENRKTIVCELERDAFMGYPETDAEYFFFDQITAYRSVIHTNIERLKQSDCDSRNQKDKNSFITGFEHAVNLHAISDQDFIDEVTFKLTLTRHEWYVWMLLLIYTFKGRWQWKIINRMNYLIHGSDYSKYI